MSEMIERVARAIYEKAIERASLLTPLGFDNDPPSWEELRDPDRTSALGEAEAAIEAMREPTEAMLSAFRERAQPIGNTDAGYKAMINAALDPKQKAQRAP